MTEETLRTEAGERLFRTDGGGDRETGDPLFTLPHGQVRDLLTVMSGRVRVDFTPEQGELPL